MGLLLLVLPSKPSLDPVRAVAGGPAGCPLSAALLSHVPALATTFLGFGDLEAGLLGDRYQFLQGVPPGLCCLLKPPLTALFLYQPGSSMDFRIFSGFLAHAFTSSSPPALRFIFTF